MEFIIRRFVLATLFFISFFGLGRLIRYMIPFPKPIGFALSVSLGMSFYIFLSGVLSAFGIFYESTVVIVTLLGVVMTMIVVIKHFSHWNKNLSLKNSMLQLPLTEMLLILISLALILIIIINVDDGICFNHHDDFHRYFVTLSKASQTGSLAFMGNVFNSTFWAEPGGQSAFHMFMLAWGSINDVWLFDVVCGFLLSILLVLECRSSFGSTSFAAFCGGLLLILVDPQYVNISSFYSAVAMILVVSLILRRISESSSDSRKRKFLSIYLGLTISTLMLFKIVFLPFAIVLFLTYWGRQKTKSRDFNPGFAEFVYFILGILCTILSWVFQNYSAFAKLIPLYIKSWSSLPSFSNPEMFFHWKNIVDFRVMEWGGSIAGYIWLFIIVVFAWPVSLLLKRFSEKIKSVSMTPIISLAFALAISAILNIYIYWAFDALRYLIPMILSSAIITTLLYGKLLSSLNLAKKHLFAISIVFLFVIITPFMSSLIKRADRLTDNNQLISFEMALKPWYKHNIKSYLSNERMDYVRSRQNLFPRGSTIFAWIGSPFLLDFRRNDILVANMPAFFASEQWCGKNGYVKSETLRDYFKSKGVQHVIWAYTGHLITQGDKDSPFLYLHWIAKTNECAMRSLKMLESDSKNIYKDQKLSLFSL